ncbi:hypothetical protein IQ270_25045 [Microcoleus sp. LEGE 07076]|uniref:hypothetical protein n=1 Tax=Microcoleus sp. LEGE 07076 TaxID=915322 RepID=UPI001A02A17E|nr:hypothetical protein [Microcoleus sp. LEGE 07076]
MVVIGYWLFVIGYLLLVICCLLLVVGCWLFVICHLLFVVCYWLFVIGYLLLVVGCWLLVVGCWLLVVGYLSLVIGYWLLVIGQYRRPQALFWQTIALLRPTVIDTIRCDRLVLCETWLNYHKTLRKYVVLGAIERGPSPVAREKVVNGSRPYIPQLKQQLTKIDNICHA